MTDFPPIGRPAVNALAQAGYTQLEDLRGVQPQQLLELHGVGPKAVRILEQALSDLAKSD
jgi:hypothetical protein